MTETFINEKATKSDMVRLDPGVDKRPDKESVVKDKDNTLLRNGRRRITVHLKKQQPLSVKLTQETNTQGKQFKLLQREIEKTPLLK
jgi:hypothetical protein